MTIIGLFGSLSSASAQTPQLYQARSAGLSRLHGPLAAFDHLDAKDQPSAKVTAVNARGWSAWVTPRTTKGIEGLFRYDHVEPDTALPSQSKERTIGGIAYWFPHQSGITTALMFDVDNLKFAGYAVSTVTATQRKFAVHMLINY